MLRSNDPEEWTTAMPDDPGESSVIAAILRQRPSAAEVSARDRLLGLDHLDRGQGSEGDLLLISLELALGEVHGDPLDGIEQACR